MAIQIPTYSGPTVDQRPLSIPFENTNTTGAGAPFQVASDAIEGAAKVGLKAKREADQQATLEAFNAYRAFTDAGLERVKQAEGENAAVEAQKFYAEADKKAKEIYEQLGNDEQRLAFSNAANGEMAQLRAAGEHHVGEQIRVSRDLAFHGALATSLKRSTDNATTPGYAEKEAENTRNLIRAYAASKGMPSEAVKAVEDEKVGLLYASKVEKLLAEDHIQEAHDVIIAHSTELGEHATQLMGKVQVMNRNVQAQAEAEKFAKQFPFPDGTFNLQAARDAAEKAHPPGLLREAVNEALDHRAARARAGAEMVDKAHWEAAMGFYNDGGLALLKTKKAWSDLDHVQQKMMEQRALADASERDSQPLSPEQMLSLRRLQYDIASRDEFWSTTDASALDRNADFNKLPPHLRAQIGASVAQLHNGRANVSTMFKSIERTVLERAQSDGRPLASTKKKKGFDDWEESEINSWGRIQDSVKTQIADWKAKNPKSEFLPNSEVEKFVDNATRNAKVVGGIWKWLGGTTDVPLADAIRNNQRVITEVPWKSEEELGRNVLLRQGWQEKEITPQKIIDAANLWRSVTGTVPPQEYERIRSLLAGKGKRTSDADIRTYWEAEQLKYQR